MAEQTKKSVMAIVAEVTEGTPVLPTAATEYIALQDGFDIEPAFEELASAEFTGSIGKSKVILGIENPTASLSHYIRHSGIEGQEPDFGLLLEGAFGGKKIVSTERNTIVGSTAGTATVRGIVKVDTGEGVEFERGQAMLIKDGTNNYGIRNVFSVSSDDLNLSFNLANAPGTGIDLGKPVMYKPGEAHPSLSVWDFHGNGHSIQLVAGAKVSEMSIEANAGQLVNGSFTLDGVKYFFNPITISASNNKLDFSNDAIPTELTATVTNGTYRDPHELASAIETAMNSVSADVITVTYDDSTGKFTLASDGGVFELLWATGTNTANTIGTILGFSILADDDSATSYIGDGAIDLSSYQTPDFDDEDPLVAKAGEVLVGSFSDLVCFDAATMTLTMTNTIASINSVCSDSGRKSTQITEREVTVEVSGELPRYDVDKFKRYRSNEETAFTFNFGIKSGGNWVAGRCGNVYIPTATFSSFKEVDSDGLIFVEATLSAFVGTGLGEVYLNFL